MLAAYFFSREHDLDQDVVRTLRREVDAYITAHSQHFPSASPAGSDEAAGVGRIEALRLSLKDGNPHPRGAGHDVIYAALALRALHAFPQLATGERVEGISRLLKMFWHRFQGPAGGIPHPGTAEYADTKEMARTTLRRYLVPRHLVHSGPTRPVALIHWITHAEALMTLDELGYREEALQGFGVLERATNHREENNPEGRIVAKPAIPSSSLTAAFWEHPAVREGGWLFSHSFKFPYSLHRLLKHADDPELVPRSLERARLLIANGA